MVVYTCVLQLPITTSGETRYFAQVFPKGKVVRACWCIVRVEPWVCPCANKIQGYIKNKKVTILIDSGSTHNFINYKLEKDLNCFLYHAPEFQVMIANGGTINCSRKFHSINLNTGEYFLDSPMISIQMGGVDVVIRVQWLQSLGIVAFDFQNIFMRFSSNGKGN
jgi:hypothetical protein